ncbi:hypothetical protein ABTY96_10370 [Streptomyces sp. NPDC096057]
MSASAIRFYADDGVVPYRGPSRAGTPRHSG